MRFFFPCPFLVELKRGVISIDGTASIVPFVDSWLAASMACDIVLAQVLPTRLPELELMRTRTTPSTLLYMHLLKSRTGFRGTCILGTVTQVQF